MLGDTLGGGRRKVQASGQLPRYDHHIDGARVPPGSRDYLPSEDPFTGKAWALIGRESGTEAIKEYLHTKSVWISTDLDVPNPFVRR